MYSVNKYFMSIISFAVWQKISLLSSKNYYISKSVSYFGSLIGDRLFAQG